MRSNQSKLILTSGVRLFLNMCCFKELLFFRLQEERQKLLEELLQDLKEALQEGEERIDSPDEAGTIRSRVWEICRQSLSQAKQEWEKVSKTDHYTLRSC